MLLRFPQFQPGVKDASYLVCGQTPYAKHNMVTKPGGKSVGFLTEHSAMFILQGAKVFHFGEEAVSVEAGQLILVRRGIYTISEFIPEEGKFEALILFLPQQWLAKLALAAPNLSTVSHLILPASGLLSAFAQNYLHYFRQQRLGPQNFFELKLQELYLLLQMTAHAPKVISFLAHCCHPSVKLEYIVREHLFQPLSVEDYARLCLRSLASFKRDFEREFGVPPRQWINEQRIHHARGLLRSSRKTVNEIAEECGYENCSYFIKVFKKLTGKTPLQVRAENITQ